MGSRFFPIHRSDSGLTNASFRMFPGAANLFLFSVCCALYRFEKHLTGLELTAELQKLASIRSPTLVPHFSRRVVDAETLTFMAVGILIVLPQNASIEYAVHMDARHLFGGAVDVEDVPVSNPEVQLAIFGRRTGVRFR